MTCFLPSVLPSEEPGCRSSPEALLPWARGQLGGSLMSTQGWWPLVRELQHRLLRAFQQKAFVLSAQNP